MYKVALWKPLLIFATIAVCILLIIPPSEKLKLGLDLEGGTTLVYQLDVPEHADAQRDIEDTIAVLRARVDPTGVRNLVWRQTAGNRIEIQMSHASPAIKQLREKFVDARDRLFVGNISKLQIDAALRAPAAQRPSAFEQLAAGNTARREILNDLGRAYDALESARVPKDQAEQLMKQASGALAKLPAEASADQRHSIEQEVASIQTDLTAKARAYLDAKRQFDAVRQQALATNVEPGELENILALSVESKDNAKAAANPRQAAFDALIASHHARAEQIKEVAAAYAAYDAVRGPLDDPNDLIQLLHGSGVLEFRIAPAPDEVPDLLQYKEQLRTRGPRGTSDKRYKWVPIDDITSFAETPALQAQLKADPEGYFAHGRGMIAQAYGDRIYLLLDNSPEGSLTHEKSGWQLTDARPSQDERGFQAVAFQLNEIGGHYMGQLTNTYKGKPMAIVLDDKVRSSPTINGAITTSGIITGGSSGFSNTELEYLVRTLKAGSLKARLSEDPISIQTTGATFGLENLHAGLRAAAWATVIVCGFMLTYYFMLGMVASFALAVNILFVLAVMAMMSATFTLSGIAGVVLTIGMAVDANVLIYERIREEMARGRELKRAVQLGFQKAFTTIIDAHVTTMITCVILYYTATADIKGFALTLGIGLVANLFTAIFCSRVLIELYMSWFKPHTILMLPIVAPTINRIFLPNIDWVGKKFLYIGISGVLTIGGMIGIYMRGADFLDIEFRSGTQVTFELAHNPDGSPKQMTIVEVRKRLAQASERSKAVEELKEATPVTVGKVDHDMASAFTVQTLATDSHAVSDAIKAAFADVLDVQRPISFNGIGEGNEPPQVNKAPVYVIRSATLGANINRPNVNADVGEYLGGIAVVLEDMHPAATVEQIADRIKRLSSQPEYEHLGYHPPHVIGLDLAGNDASQPAAANSNGKALYSSVAVVLSDEHTNYVDNPDSFTNSDANGFAATQWGLVREALRRDTSLAGVTNFSSQVSGTMQQQAIVAIVLSWIAITIYIWIRFGSLAYGLGAIIALIHDVITAVGLAAWAFYFYDTAIGHALLLAPFRIDLTMIAAVLTLIGYSVNDTIVVFDRIRENRGRLAYASPQVINDSINQTISRTVLTVATVLVAVLALYVLGGPGVHNFAFVMLVGAIVGCYSSIAVASPLLLLIKHTPEQAKAKPHESLPGTLPTPR